MRAGPAFRMICESLGLVLCCSLAVAAPAGAAHTFVAQWGGQGSGAGQFEQPSAIGVDVAGNVYVSDTGNDRIQKFSPTGAFITAWGGSGTAEGQFSDPRGVDVDNIGRVYVSDYGNNRIQRFDTNGNFELMWGWGVDDGTAAAQSCASGCQAGSPGTGNAQFNGPQGLDAGIGGGVWVADGFNRRVQRFNANGAFHSRFGTSGSGDGQFNNIYDVADDGAGNTYAADANNRIQRFDVGAQFVTKWGSSGSADEIDDAKHRVRMLPRISDRQHAAP